jgi:hypothetical protein
METTLALVMLTLAAGGLSAQVPVDPEATSLTASFHIDGGACSVQPCVRPGAFDPPARFAAAPERVPLGSQIGWALVGGGLGAAAVSALAASRGGSGYEVWLPGLLLGYPLGVGSGVSVASARAQGSAAAAYLGAVLGMIPGVLMAQATVGTSLLVMVPLGSIALYNATAKSRDPAPEYSRAPHLGRSSFLSP